MQAFLTHGTIKSTVEWRGLCGDGHRPVTLSAIAIFAWDDRGYREYPASIAAVGIRSTNLLNARSTGTLIVTSPSWVIINLEMVYNGTAAPRFQDGRPAVSSFREVTRTEMNVM